MTQCSSNRNISGILLLDKPLGLTSNQALQQAKRIFNANKAGHTGSLDPLASGMLPICFGETTKFSQYLLEADKRYRVTAKLGVSTTTGDAEGEIVARSDPTRVTLKKLNEVLVAFRGEIAQIPSMYSALKHQGQPLYKLARQGITVERQSRQVTIYELILREYANDEINLEVHCSKGTYVRTLIEDIGSALQCGAHVNTLRRLSVGGYQSAQMLSLDQLVKLRETGGNTLIDKQLHPLESMMTRWPTVLLPKVIAYYLRKGQAVLVPHAPTAGWVNLIEESGSFLGVGEILTDGRVAPRRLVSTRKGSADEVIKDAEEC